MQPISAIIEITVKKIKEPAFILLFGIALIIGYLTSGTSTFTFQNDDSTLTAILSVEKGVPLLAGFAMILSMTLLVSIFTGATDIPREIEARMVMLILAKPLTRSQYVIGKYLGIIIISIIFFSCAATTSLIAYFIKSGSFYQWNVFLRQCFLIITIFPFVAMAMMISTFLNDIAAMIVVAVYIVIGAMVSIMDILIDLLPKSLGVASYIHSLAYFFPNLFFFLQQYKLVSVISVYLIIYSLSMTIIFLAIATMRLNSRDLI
jgi:ABC-type transport system involved in multi-copper enzyme maturation permease subunit